MKLSLTEIAIGLVTVTILFQPTAKAIKFSHESNLTVANRYLWRGFDVSQSDPALQADYTLSHESGAWLGVWGTNYDTGSDNGVEIDLMGGYQFSITPDLTVEVGFIEYVFTGDTDSSTEYNVSVSYSPLSFTYYKDVDLDTQYYSLDSEFNVASALDLTLHWGKYDLTDGEGNNDYSVGLNYAINQQLSTFAVYSKNDLRQKYAGNHLLFGLSYAF